MPVLSNGRVLVYPIAWRAWSDQSWYVLSSTISNKAKFRFYRQTADGEISLEPAQAVIRADLIQGPNVRAVSCKKPASQPPPVTT